MLYSYLCTTCKMLNTWNEQWGNHSVCSGAGPLIPLIPRWESRIILQSADFRRHFVSHFLHWSIASVSCTVRDAPSGLSQLLLPRARSAAADPPPLHARVDERRCSGSLGSHHTSARHSAPAGHSLGTGAAQVPDPDMALKIVKGSIDRMFDKNLQDLVRGIRNHKEDEVTTTG